MSKGSWYRPVDQKKYGESYDRIFGPKEKEVSEETKSLHKTLSHTGVRNELNLPNKPEECDLNDIHTDGCPLDEAKNKCKGCIIGRKKNDDRRRDDTKGQIQTENDVQSSNETGIS